MLSVNLQKKARNLFMRLRAFFGDLFKLVIGLRSRIGECFLVHGPVSPPVNSECFTAGAVDLAVSLFGIPSFFDPVLMATMNFTLADLVIFP